MLAPYTLTAPALATRSVPLAVPYPLGSRSPSYPAHLTPGVDILGSISHNSTERGSARTTARKGRLTGLGGSLAALAALAAPVWAGSASAPLTVSATAVRSCVIRAVAPGSVEAGCANGAGAAPPRSSTDRTAATMDRVGPGAAAARGPVVREFPSGDGASVLVTVDF